MIIGYQHIITQHAKRVQLVPNCNSSAIKSLNSSDVFSSFMRVNASSLGTSPDSCN